MYCPECRAEYREGFTECADCGVPMVSDLPPEPASRFDPNLPLAVVLETNDPVELAWAKDALDQAGIPFFVLNQISMLVNDLDPMLRKWVRLQVAADREQEAREVLTAGPAEGA